jgi:hypothetical protein
MLFHPGRITLDAVEIFLGLGVGSRREMRRLFMEAERRIPQDSLPTAQANLMSVVGSREATAEHVTRNPQRDTSWLLAASLLCFYFLARGLDS